MASEKDSIFGVMAIRMKYVTQGQVKECLGIQARMRGMGIEEALGEVLRKKGYLTDQQSHAVLRAMGVTSEEIPGYKLLSKVGQGGMGTVYKATQITMNRTVAIKVLSSLMTEDPAFVARFVQEARAAGTLNHKNIVSVFDAGEANGRWYFVMEYFEGRSLRDIVLKDGPLDEGSVLEVARQVADALDYIHQHRMVHRDIKPENLMLGVDGTVKLCDFGLARSQQAEQSLTQSGFAVGTPYYMAPEQVTGEKDVDIRADLYALGATLYYLATGRFVFEGKTAAETMSMHLTQPVADPRRFAPRLAEDLVHVLHKLLEKNRILRYQTPRELIDDLDRMRQGAAPHHARQHAAARRSHTRRFGTVRVGRRRTAAPLVVAAGGAVLAVVLVVVVSSGTAAPGPADRPAESPLALPATPAPPPPTPEPPRVDREREDRAFQLFAQASREFETGRFREAKASLDRLRREFDGTLLVAERRTDVNRMIGHCEQQLAEQIREVERRYREAQALMRPGSWSRARDLLLALRKDGMETPNVTPAALDRDLGLCDTEIAAEGCLSRISGAFGDGRWDLVLTEAGAFRRGHAGTRSGRDMDAQVAAWTAKAQLEIDADKAVGDAKRAALNRSWDEVLALLESIEKQYHATQAYSNNAGVLERLRREHMTAMKLQMEDAARDSWPEVEGRYRTLMAQGKHDAAAEVLREWERKYEPTQEHQARRAPQVKSYLAAAAQAKARAREERAQELVKAAKAAAQNRLWDDCHRTLEQLQAEFADTKAHKDGAPALRQMREACERDGGFGPHVLLKIEFEEDSDGLAGVGDADVPGRFEWSGDPAHGKRAGRVVFSPYQRGDWTAVVHDVPKGLDVSADLVSVWLKYPKKSPGGPVRLIVEEFDPYESFTAEVAGVTTEWKRYQAPLADFARFWGDDGNRRLDRAKVRRIGFVQRGRDEAQEFFADALRVEMPPKK